MSETEFRRVNYYISMYDVYGKQMGYYDSDWFSDGAGAVEQGKSYDFENIMNVGGMYYNNGKEINIKKSGKGGIP